ncbi:MAG: type II secretion system F family protein [Candidatus Pacebacteria bacterium]|jgi:type IV pilus assembly protein PilC|nr:type II secretion system F family protein [Candidatus Paceibacterota bacterium]MBP9701055.1 type II secretion system F family protein [Candidatus Paceibacterota bacterium]
MNFTYQAITNTGEKRDGMIEAVNKDLAMAGLQRRGLIVTSIKDEKESKKWFEISVYEKVPMKQVVILSRQISTLFEAQVSALKAFSLLAENSQNKLLSTKLSQIVTDLQGGSSIANALAKHPDVFSDFYVNMVKAGEESGKLTQVFSYMADYLDRQYALTSKTKHALVYPTFVIGIFIAVMVLMFTVVVPKLSAIITESGQEVPFYTKIVMAISSFLVQYGIFLLIGVVVFFAYIIRLSRTKRGKQLLDEARLGIPVVGNLYQKLYLARIADNMDTMLSSGIPIIRSIEITARVVGNKRYEAVMLDAMESVKSGKALSAALAMHPTEIPKIMTQIILVGEETGSMGSILKMLAKFYNREVDEAVDTLVGLIEPFMIISLGIGVGLLLVSILVPIYNIAGGIS